MLPNPLKVDDLEQMFAMLPVAERCTGRSSLPHNRRFLVLSDWLIRPEMVVKSIPRGVFSQTFVPTLNGINLLRLLKRLSMRESTTVATHAVMINVRNHWRRTGLVRSFYLNPFRSTIKAAIHSTTGGALVRKEIENRRIVTKIGSLPLPVVLGTGTSEKLTFIEEEWIEGRPVRGSRDIDVIVASLFPRLLDHYRAYGIRHVNITNCIAPDFATKAESVLNELQLTCDCLFNRVFSSYLSSIAERDLSLPVSFCHADLNLGHIAITRDRGPIIVDWDAARESMIALDLVELMRSPEGKSRSLLGAAVYLLQAVSGFQAYSAIDQLIIAAFHRLARAEELQTRFAKEGRANLFAELARNAFGLVDFLFRERHSFE